MCDKFDDDQVYYGYYRVEETYDEKVKNTVKFGLVRLICDKLSAVFKGQLATHRGFVSNLFHPFHDEFVISSKKDASEEIIRKRIRLAMFKEKSVLKSKKEEDKKEASA